MPVKLKSHNPSLKKIKKEKLYLVVFIVICLVLVVFSRSRKWLNAYFYTHKPVVYDQYLPAGKALVAGQKINLNQAGQVELEALPGVGPKRASGIIALREKMNGFGTVDDLLKIKGISVRVLDQIRPYVVVTHKHERQ